MKKTHVETKEGMAIARQNDKTGDLQFLQPGVFLCWTPTLRNAMLVTSKTYAYEDINGKLQPNEFWKRARIVTTIDEELFNK